MVCESSTWINVLVVLELLVWVIAGNCELGKCSGLQCWLHRVGIGLSLHCPSTAEILMGGLVSLSVSLLASILQAARKTRSWRVRAPVLRVPATGNCRLHWCQAEYNLAIEPAVPRCRLCHTPGQKSQTPTVKVPPRPLCMVRLFVCVCDTCMMTFLPMSVLDLHNVQW